jgi:hypothetical protein
VTTPPEDRDGPPRAVVIAAIAVAALAVVGVLIVAAVSEKAPPPSPVAVVAIPAPGAESPECTALAAALPERMDDYERAELANPAPAGAAAWRTAGGGDPVILRCGIDRPLDFVAGTPVQMVNDVAWFRIADTGRTTWIAVDRPVYVALTLPDGSGSLPIQAITKAVTDTMPARPIETGPPR